ncbi:ChbG/HpnK family deacetylase [Phreatobacter aquaticus]|uniref:ChbG/HpnK family deacetylase n=1 Tax=Phreatobacter aquaticus TaxID=2570229 RepID=A0A4D7QKS9_9HYPH|nr:ChbG/HpnK family deacetylase [Phreatobacter aquaticus]QCK85994.1 ChbG/HpnK family deacetylase [Phreatobacter aquaticus]
MKRLILCADDYALAPGVSRAIRELAGTGRLNATSVMTPGPDLGPEAEALTAIAPPGFEIGLHVTLTGGLSPLTRPALPHYFGLGGLMARCFARRIKASVIEDEVEAQFQAFLEAFGRAPDFVDGHQHVHLLPVVRPIVVAACRRHAPKAWLRQCAGVGGTGRGPKGQILATLSSGLKHDARTGGFATNPAFSGAYDFRKAAAFPDLFPRFLDRLPDGSLVMVHPGHVDEDLTHVDPVHGPRAIEYAYLAGDRFPRDLAAAGFTLR